MVRQLMLKKFVATYRNLPGQVYILGFATLTNRLGSIAQIFLFLYLTRNLGWSLSIAGTVVSCFGIGSLIGSYLGGVLANKFSARNLLSLCLAANACPLALLAIPGSPLQLSAIVVLMGFFSGAFRPIYNYNILATCREGERGPAYSVYLLALNLGDMIAGTLGGILNSISFVVVCYVDAATCIVSSVLVLLLQRPIGTRTADTPRGSDEGRIFSVEPFKDRAFLALCGSVLIIAFVTTQMYTTYPTYLSDHYKTSSTFYGALLSINGAIGVAMQLPVATLFDRWSHGTRAIVGTLLLCLGFAALPLGASAVFAVISLVVWTVGDIIESPSTTVMVMSMAERGDKGSYLGVYHGLYAFAYMVGPGIGAAIYGLLGGGALWALVGALGLLAAYLFLAAQRISAKASIRAPSIG
jgi:predicted MFS family arabinose efflux permease